MKNAVSQPLLFNYSEMDSDTTIYLQQNAQETRGLLKRTSEDIIQIGKNLLEAKARIPHGQFIPWAKAELGISQSTSWRFMQAAQGKEIKGKSFTVNDMMAQICAPAEDQTVEARPVRSDMIPYSLLGPWEVGNPKGNAVRGVLCTGQLLCNLFDDQTVEEVEEFAWSEFRLVPPVASQYMLYGSRYPNPTGMISPKVFDALLELHIKRNDTMVHILGFLNNPAEYMGRILNLGRGFMMMQFIRRKTPGEYAKWLKTNFQLSVEVAEVVINYVLTYASVPVEAISTDKIIWDIADTWTRYSLYNFSIRIGEEPR
jgi:Protein of unknown function (DUF3102)